MVKREDWSVGIYPVVSGIDYVLWVHRRSVQAELVYDLTATNDFHEPERIRIVSEPDIIQITGEPLDEREFFGIRNFLIKHASILEAFWLGQIKDGPALVAKIQEAQKDSGFCAG